MQVKRIPLGNHIEFCTENPDLSSEEEGDFAANLLRMREMHRGKSLKKEL